MQLSIHIKDPVHRAYLKAVLPMTDDGALKVSNITFTGSVICTSVKPTDTKLQPTTGEDIVLLDIPASCYTLSLRNKFLMITLEGERQINNILRHEFNSTLLNYCTIRINQGMKLRDALFDFIADYNLLDHMDFEGLKKRHYRASLEAINDLYSTHRKRFYYLAKKYSEKK